MAQDSKPSINVVYVVTGTHFRALRAHGACEAGFFMANFVLPRRFHRGITHPHTPTHGQKTPDGWTDDGQRR